MTKVPKIYYLVLKISLNNIFINILNNQGNTICLETLGTLGIKGRLRKRKNAKTLFAESLALKIQNLKITKVNLILKGFAYDRTRILRGLLSRGLIINYISEFLQIPFNGCRLKKKKRKKKKATYKLFIENILYKKLI